MEPDNAKAGNYTLMFCELAYWLVSFIWKEAASFIRAVLTRYIVYWGTIISYMDTRWSHQSHCLKDRFSEGQVLQPKEDFHQCLSERL